METLERPRLNGASHGAVHTVTLEPKPQRPGIIRIVLSLAVVLALIVGGLAVVRLRATSSPGYVTVPVARRDLVQTVSATGTVNPQNTISVGTQVSGTISEIDVDYNSKVHTGQVLARLDTTALQEQLDSARAALAQAQQQAQAAQASAAGAVSNVAVARASAAAAAANALAAQATAQSNEQAIAAAQADVTKSQSALQLAQETVSRDQTLLAQGYIPQSQLDTDRSNLVAAQSTLAAAQTAVTQARSQATASIAQAQAGQAQTVSQEDAIAAAQDAATNGSASAAAGQAAVAIQEANVAQAETNLAHAVITSPVNGTVIARNVSIGETVAASFQTPTLFTIAQDLNKMEVDLAVGEPDIGSVQPGENVAFSVLAYPNATFDGVVSQVRKNPTVTQNVVTYDAVVLVDNTDQKLLPGMTANATIDVADAPQALVVPLQALSFVPGGAAAHAHDTSPWGTTTAAANATILAGSSGRVFVDRNGKLVPVPVGVDLVSGTSVAITAGAANALEAGDAVVIAQNGAGARTSAARSTSPLAMQSGGAMRGFH